MKCYKSKSLSWQYILMLLVSFSCVEAFAATHMVQYPEGKHPFSSELKRLAKRKLPLTEDFPEPLLYMDTARLEGRFLGYRSEMQMKLSVISYSTILGEFSRTEVAVAHDGTFYYSLPVYHLTEVSLVINDKEHFFFLQPGNTVCITIDTYALAQASSTDPTGSEKAPVSFYFEGAAARINTDYFTLRNRDLPENNYEHPNWSDAWRCRESLMRTYYQKAARLEKDLTVCPVARVLLRNAFAVELLEGLRNYGYYYEKAQGFDNGIAGYWTFIRDLPLTSDYCIALGGYAKCINQLQYVRPTFEYGVDEEAYARSIFEQKEVERFGELYARGMRGAREDHQSSVYTKEDKDLFVLFFNKIQPWRCERFNEQIYNSKQLVHFANLWRVEDAECEK